MDNVSEPTALDAQRSSLLRGSRTGFRFSLRALCEIVAMACVVAGLWGVARRERAAVERASELAQVVETQAVKNLRLREELGYLTITDPAKVHVLQLPTRETLHWKWQIYLPGGKWTLFNATRQIPPRGYDVAYQLKSTIHAGEFTLEAMVVRDAEGLARLLMFAPRGRHIQSLGPETFERLEQRAWWSSMGGDSRECASSSSVGSAPRMEVRDAAGGPIELLRLRTSNDPSSDEPTFGVLLWIEPYRPGRAGGAAVGREANHAGKKRGELQKVCRPSPTRG